MPMMSPVSLCVLRTGQVGKVEQLVLPAVFFECIAGFHLLNHPVQIGVVECGGPLLDFLHGGNERLKFPLPCEYAQAIQIFLSEERWHNHSACFDNRQLCVHDEAR